MQTPNQGFRQNGNGLEVLRDASQTLNILDPASGGDKELIKSVAVEIVKLQLQMGV